VVVVVVVVEERRKRTPSTAAGALQYLRRVEKVVVVVEEDTAVPAQGGQQQEVHHRPLRGPREVKADVHAGVLGSGQWEGRREKGEGRRGVRVGVGVRVSTRQFHARVPRLNRTATSSRQRHTHQF
jgi:hypothetical protein